MTLTEGSISSPDRRRILPVKICWAVAGMHNSKRKDTQTGAGAVIKPR
jgi:hypothetical protein